ncbi:nitroreductase family protein [Candidatus Micrarchaeota archaeon]|nr:nitroreductase family protein [Candidatus Micrarchaeota archaeon]
MVVKGKEAKKLAKATKWSALVEGASAVIVVCADMKKGNRWVEDCSIAVAHMMLQATELGLGTCWVQVKEATEKTLKNL